MLVQSMLDYEQYGNRKFILSSLYNYETQIVNGLFKNYEFENLNNVKEFDNFIKNNPNCFDRTCLKGHLTGSAFIINSKVNKVLFTYHAKLKKWLQLGGHCDGDFLVHNVAIKEAKEESGVENFYFLDLFNFPEFYSDATLNKIHPIPFDIDIHFIPARKNEPSHFHYDVCYLLSADEQSHVTISDESIDLKWISFSEIHYYTKEVSISRQLQKIKTLINF
jgi:8-oxo-dGTP pyrophosphatase MutT (NUDIX family)